VRWWAAGRRDDGVYAVLYAVLVVVLIGMAAIVVDLASVRQDRRLDRSAADSAVLGGASFLDPSGGAASTPLAACQKAWQYLATTLRISVPGSACSSFIGVPLTPCPVNEIPDNTTVPPGDITVRVSWPIPKTGGSGFLSPDLAPGAVTQGFASKTDGSDAGCDRLGVAIFQTSRFGLAGAFGASSTQTQVHSVALTSTLPKRPGDTAALNVLNTTVCQALSTGGQGKIVVNRATDLSRGVMAVESDGSGCGNNNQYVIDVSSNNNNKVCASGPSQVPDNLGTCDGQGKIVQHALDVSAGLTKAYAGSPNAVTAGYPLSPQPQAEGGISLWNPVTKDYGCKSLPLVAGVTQACSSYPPYIGDLYTDLDKNSPTPYPGVGTYSGIVYGGSFTTLNDGTALAPYGGLGTFTCAQANNASSKFYVPAGYWYVNCPDSNNAAGFQVSSEAVFGGGQIDFAGGVQVAKNNACFSVNTPFASLPATPDLLSCPTATSLSNEQATTVPAPIQEAIVFIRGVQGFTNGSSGTSILLPQTLVAQSNGGLLGLGGGAGTLLWTAPGAGTLTSGVSRLDTLCTLASVLDPTCQASHFSKTAYWNEVNTTGSQLLSIKGQGSLSLVGTFFAPRGDFSFDGQGSYFATNAQFWVDTLALSGQGGLGLTPDASLSFKRPSFAVSLIR
jgi:hypothetical protein